MEKHKIDTTDAATKKKIKEAREHGFLPYIDKSGNITAVKAKRGGTKKHRTCRAPKKK